MRFLYQVTFDNTAASSAVLFCTENKKKLWNNSLFAESCSTAVLYFFSL